MNVDPYYRQQKCRSITLVSGNMRQHTVLDSCRHR